MSYLPIRIILDDDRATGIILIVYQESSQSEQWFLSYAAGQADRHKCITSHSSPGARVMLVEIIIKYSNILQLWFIILYTKKPDKKFKDVREDLGNSAFFKNIIPHKNAGIGRENLLLILKVFKKQ